VSAARAPLGAGLYFIDVLACLLFCLVLALVGARFGREHSVELDLPELAASDRDGASLTEREIALRERDGGLEIWLDGEPLSLEELAQRLEAETPPAVVVRSEASALSRVVGIAHGAGVRQIELAYELAGSKAKPSTSREGGGSGR
jgi:biopolymer transport protein ExbD